MTTRIILSRVVPISKRTPAIKRVLWTQAFKSVSLSMFWFGSILRNRKLTKRVARSELKKAVKANPNKGSTEGALKSGKMLRSVPNVKAPANVPMVPSEDATLEYAKALVMVSLDNH